MEAYGFIPTYTDTVDYLEEVNPEALFADGLEEACIGHTEVYQNDKDGNVNRVALAVYSKQKVASILVERDKMTPEEAYEYADFNIYSAYMGPNTPLFVDETYTGFNRKPFKTQPVLPEEMYEL